MVRPSRCSLWSTLAVWAVVLVLSVVVAAEPTPQPQHRRQLWDVTSLFSVLAAKIHANPCDGPDPLHKCAEWKRQHADSTADYDSTTTTDYDYEAVQSNNGDSFYEDRQTANGGMGTSGGAGMNLWLLATAGSAVAAVAAIHVGQRRNPVSGSSVQVSSGQPHSLQASVGKRTTLVSAFAAGMLKPHNQTPETTESGVELQPGYALEVDDATGGVELQPTTNVMV